MNRIELKSDRSRGCVTRGIRNRRLRPTVLALEGRTLLSTFTVNSTADDGSAGTLRWAIGQANASNQADTIDFSSLFNTPQTITLSSGSLLLTDSATTTITGPGANVLTVSGGGKSRVFDIDGASAALSGLTISGGSADSGGGLLNVGGTMVLTNCAVSGNAATDQGGGQATQFGGTTTFTGCTVSGNTAPAGAGLFNSGGTLSLVDSTVSGNTAGGKGGGLYNSGGTATLTNDTVSTNTAATAGGIAVGGASTTLTNTIVAGNTGGDVSGTVAGGNNLIGGDPKLASLGDYGGPTFTMALLPGSPAIGTGTRNGAPATDQRGFTRGGSVDIGTFQSQGTALVVNTSFGGVGSASGQLSLPQAVNLANVLPTADTISIATSAFSDPQTITLTAAPLVLTDTATTTITGPGANVLTVSGNKASRVFDIQSGSAAISGLTIADGASDSGGGLRNDGGTTTLTDCTVSGNAATVQGGGLYNFDGALSLSGCTVYNNTAPAGAGLAASGGTLTMTNATFSQNVASGQGGGLYLRLGTAALTNCTVAANSAATGGGLVNSNNTATVTLTNTIIAGQTAGGDVTGNFTGGNNLIGGNPLLGTLLDYGGPTLTAPPLLGSPALGAGAAGAGVPTTDQRGFARGGSVDIGAFQTQGAAAMEVNVTTDGLGSGLSQLDLRQAINLANIQPGTNTVSFDPSVFGTTPRTITLTAGEIGLGSAGAPVIDGPGASLLSINANGASRVFVHSVLSVTLSGLTITGGNATRGGGVYIAGGTTTLTDCTVSGNGSNARGGGVYAESGTVALTDCTISGNTAAEAGGGLFNFSATIKLTNSTVSGNTADFGGGVANLSQGTIALTNCTVSGNSASGGGGLYTGNAGELTLTNCTVSGNSATNGGGLYADGGPVTLTNTIIAGNGGGDVSGAYSGSNNLIGGNPLLAPLGNYGGPTATMALLPGSPAIGGGTATGSPTTDQRGVSRLGHVDIGAFQSLGFALLSVAGSSPQTAAVGQPFADALAVAVTANNSVEPVDGGVVSFTVNPVGGASATLSAATTTITGGVAGVTATADGTTGTYTVSASAAAAVSAGFALTNTEAPSLVLTTARDVVDPVDSLTSLREAVAYANSHPGPDTITLDPAVFGSKRQTIVLTGGPLVLTDPATTTIIGPGAKRLTISGGRKGRVFDVEGGSLALEGLTITGGRAKRGGGIRNDGGTLALDRVVLSGNHARVGGALFNDGTANLTHVVLRGNSARVGAGLFSTRRATLTRRGRFSAAATGAIVSDNFSGTGGVPKNWQQILGAAGNISERPGNLTITDSTGTSAGIVSILPSSVFNPQGLVTTMQAQIKGVNEDGNAIFGLIGLSASGSLTGYLAAGIDAHGNIFIVEQAASIAQTIVPIGVIKGYTGGSIALTFIVNSQGVQVTAPGFKSGEVPFKSLHNFSLAAAFGDGAIPALVGASQPQEKGGSATFASIRVSTALGG